MYKHQDTIDSLVPAVTALLEKHQQSTDWVSQFQQASATFKVRVPLIGTFSSGKSTLLNALIEDKIFSTSIDPQTAVPAELSAGLEAQYVGRLNDGHSINLSRSQVQENQVAELGPAGWIEVSHPALILQRWPHLCLVDMPGLDASIERHTRAFDGYIARSIAYGIAVVVKEGTLHQSLIQALREIKLHHKPVLAIITKADQVTAEDAQAVAHQVEQQITSYLGTPPLATVTTSARKYDVAELVKALDDLELQADSLYVQHVIQPVLEKLSTFKKHLVTLSNRDDLDSEEVANKLEGNRIAMEDFERNLRSETDLLKNRLLTAEKKILHRISVELEKNCDRYTRDLLAKRPINDSIMQTVRFAMAQGIQEDFSPEIQRYLNRLNEAIPEEFGISMEMPDAPDIQPIDLNTAVITSTIMEGITALLARFLPKLAGPVGMLIGLIAPLIASHFLDNKDKKMAQEDEQREGIKRELRSQYPTLIENLRPNLNHALQEQIKVAEQHIHAQVEEQRQSLQSALTTLQHQLQAGKTKFEAERQNTLLDLTQVEQWMQQLSSPTAA